MFSQDKCNYYADFVIAPVLFFTALIVQVYYKGLNPGLFVSAGLGFAIWSFLEYWIHRTLFHRFLRRQHWLHHKRPGGYVSTLNYVTAPIQLTLYGALIGSLGLSSGTGLFLGLLAGYFLYIVVHDRIHHGPRHSAYIHRRGALHDVHHSYDPERNFGVASSFWDHFLDTHFLPKRT